MRHLVCDIGGTNARFSLAQDGELVGKPLVLAAAQPELFATALDQFDDYDVVCVAAAGPVKSGVVDLTNIKLSVDATALTSLSGRPTHVINDFVAHSYGMLAYRDLRLLGGDTPVPQGVRAAIGPGSGCGMGGLIHTNDRWVAIPSEGGHANLAPGSALEAELWSALARDTGTVSWETVLCGPGLVRLYGAVSEVWGAAPEPLTAAQISARGSSMEDPVCHQTLEVFFALLGTAAGSLAMTLCATGGVYIAGGIVPRLAEFAASSALRRRFEERGKMAKLGAQIPLYLVQDPHPGLLGAHAYLLEATDHE